MSTSIVDALPNRLIAPNDARRTLAPHRLALTMLVLLCLVPRALMALKLTSVCPDGVLYIRVADFMDHGLFAQAFERIQFNVYPVILMHLHRLGIPWEAAGAGWGVLISSLTVLPLFGWLRRQFNDRIALVACFVYAMHSDLIRWSPEVIRDPTFWFLFTLSLYLVWRAVTEGGWPMHLSAGLSMALASMTRFEGLFLVAPLVLWSFRRGMAEREARARLTIGGLVCIAVYPLLLILISQLWVRSVGAMGLVRSDPLILAQRWTNKSGDASTISLSDDDPRKPLSFAKMSERFVLGFLKGSTPLFCVAALVGLAYGWQVWKRCDYRPLACTACLILFAIWIHLYWSHEAAQRYFFPIVLMATPLAALGLMKLAEGLIARFSASRARLAVCGAMMLMFGANLTAALGSDCRYRAAPVDVAQWARDRFGISPLVYGPDGVTQVVNYYSGGRCESFPAGQPDASFLARVERLRPDLVLLSADERKPEGKTGMLQGLEKLGFDPVDRTAFAGGYCRMLILARHRG